MQFRTLLWLLFLITFSSLGGQTDAGGRIIEGTGEAGIIRVQVRSPQIALQNLAERAFELHGAFELVDSDPAFTFAFLPGTAEVTVQIDSAGQTLDAETFSAPSVEAALLLAADYAVRRTLGEPGWFAGKLVFVSRRTGHRELYLASALFTEVKQLTQERSNCILPAWSPRGDKLLYTGYHNSGFPDLFEVDLRTGERKVFAAYQGTNTGGTYSPDGRLVAMILSNQGNAELYVTEVERTRQPRRLTNNTAVESGPTFSPNGRWIALTSDRLGAPLIYKIPVSGGNMQVVRTQLSRYCAEPDWNPREEGKLVFTAATAGSFQLAMHDATTNRSLFLTSGSAEAAEPVWLNDGRHVIYTRRERGEAAQLFLIDTVTGNTAQLSAKEFGGAAQADFVYPAN